jgi:hypothetical protein
VFYYVKDEKYASLYQIEDIFAWIIVIEHELIWRKDILKIMLIKFTI